LPRLSAVLPAPCSWLNDGTLISVAYDHVIPSHEPEKWNLKVRREQRSEKRNL